MRESQPHQVFGEGCEFCPQTGRPYEVGIGSLSKERQTANFLSELSPAEKAQRAKAAAALNAAAPAGSA